MDWAKSKKNCEDPWWRLCNLYTITNKQGKLVKFQPNIVQKVFYMALWWLNYVLKSRQHGLSTFVAILFLDRLLFEDDKKAGMIDYKLDDGKKKLAMMKLAYNNLDNKDIHPDTWGVGALIKSRVKLIKGQDSPFPEELVFSNKSSVYTSTSMRGGTVQYLHVSEYGKISLNSPGKAIEIIEGAENALHDGSICIYETTHEGGRTGRAYEMCKTAMENPRNKDELTRLDAMFHFFGWFLDPANVLSDEESAMVKFNAKDLEYFAEMRERDDVPELSLNQRAWYVKKNRKQGEGMLKEHPTIPEEAFQALIHGAIYGDHVARARNEGRICDFPLYKEPIYTFWDLGISDSTSIWFVQFIGQQILIHDHYENNGEDISFYGEYLRKWERDNKHMIDVNYLPHDGSSSTIGSKASPADSLREMKFKVEVLNRPPDIWTAINKLREIFPRITIHLTNCSKKWNDGIRERASGIDCLEAYRTKPEEPGKQSANKPIHDEYSHSCDGIRTMSEALLQNLISNRAYSDKEARKASPVVMGSRGKAITRY